MKRCVFSIFFVFIFPSALRASEATRIYQIQIYKSSGQKFYDKEIECNLQLGCVTYFSEGENLEIGVARYDDVTLNLGRSDMRKFCCKLNLLYRSYNQDRTPKSAKYSISNLIPDDLAFHPEKTFGYLYFESKN